MKIFTVHISYSYNFPDLVGCQDSILWYWFVHIHLYSVDWLSLCWWTLCLPGLGIIHHCCCHWLWWAVPYFIPILRLLCYYPDYLIFPTLVNFCSMLQWPAQVCNHIENHLQNCSFIGHNLNHRPLGLGQYHCTVHQLFHVHISIQGRFRLMFFCDGPGHGQNKQSH